MRVTDRLGIALVYARLLMQSYMCHKLSPAFLLRQVQVGSQLRLAINMSEHRQCDILLYKTT